MKVHYFQRYHKGEDVATANTMLLLSRLYTYSSDKFFKLLKELFFEDNDFEPEISFALQEKSDKSVPDAVITQPSFKIVVETKLTDWFYKEQLINHLTDFCDEDYKVLVTVSSEKMALNKKSDVDQAVAKYCVEKQVHIIHVNITFEEIADAVKNVLSEQDVEMKNIVDDYIDYCINDGLIIKAKMRMQLAGVTFDFNVAEGVYYDNYGRGFSAHDYLSLYKQKSIRAVGKIEAIIVATLEDNKLKFTVEKGELTEKRKNKIHKAIEDGKSYGYVLDNHRYFFVDKFFDTDFKKMSAGAPMGSRMFYLSDYLNPEEMASTEAIASNLRNKTWS